MNESATFEVVIPTNVMDKFGIVVGQKLQVVEYDSRIVLVPVRPPSELRGFVRGIDASLRRDGDRA